jgi:puromycin-sensitive aminopeptidase
MNEEDYTVWSDLSTNLSSVAVLLQYTEAYPQFKAFGRKLFKTIAGKLGWDAQPGEGNLYHMHCGKNDVRLVFVSLSLTC